MILLFSIYLKKKIIQLKTLFHLYIFNWFISNLVNIVSNKCKFNFSNSYTYAIIIFKLNIVIYRLSKILALASAIKKLISVNH